MAKVKPPTVIISGMHRSGTSLVASLLAALSVDLGDQLLPADSHNPPGYFEDVEFLSFHQGVLSQLCVPNEAGHSDWGWTESERLDDSRFSEFRDQAQRLLLARTDTTGPWGWKDPRTTLFLDFWDSLLEEGRYVLVYRFPWDVADSMQRLEAEVFLKKPEYAYRIWAFYNRRLCDFYMQHSDRCLLVSINALQENLERFVDLLSDKLDVPTRESQLQEIFKDHLFKTIGGQDPLIDLVTAAHPDCSRLLSELDELADISGAGLWQARPVKSRLSRPGAADNGTIDVSVVTPCYEQGTLLLEAIASAERHAPPRCELIIVNDGSRQPMTLEILDLLKRCGYFVIDQENAGLWAARNNAIGLARGRYILPLDDDNRIREGFLAEAIRVLDGSPEIGIVYGDRYDFGLLTAIEQIPEFDLDALLDGNYIDACAVFRKQVWIDCQGFDPLMCPLDDWEFWVHAAARGWRFHHIPRVTFDYRVRPGSLISEIRSGGTAEGFRKRIRAKHPELYWAKSVKELEAVKRLLAESVKELEAVKRLLADRDARIERMTNSRAWRLICYYGRVKHRFLSPLYRRFGRISSEGTEATSLVGLAPHEASVSERLGSPGDDRGEEIEASCEVKTSYQKEDYPLRNFSRDPIAQLAADFQQAQPFPHAVLGPNVIGATGGSGTRVFARIVRHGGMFIGDNLNVSEDSLDIGHYLDRWIDRFVPYWSSPLDTPHLSEMLEDLNLAIEKHRERLGRGDAQPWGWKEPRSIYLLPFFHSQFPKLKFLHVVRDGRDMAYSSNQNQLRKHGHTLLGWRDRLRSPPLQSIALWSRINLLAAAYGERHLGEQYLRIRFEDLCADPVPAIRCIFNFFELSGNVNEIAAREVSPPSTLGRWRTEAPRSIAKLNRIAGGALERFGY